MRGAYLINVPVVFTAKDMRNPQWTSLRQQLVKNAAELIDFEIGNVEQARKQKKSSPWSADKVAKRMGLTKSRRVR